VSVMGARGVCDEKVTSADQTRKSRSGIIRTNRVR
jgi:hypothetical protein